MAWTTADAVRAAPGPARRREGALAVRGPVRITEGGHPPPPWTKELKNPVERSGGTSAVLKRADVSAQGDGGAMVGHGWLARAGGDRCSSSGCSDVAAVG